MAKNYIKPKRPIKLGANSRPRIQSSHQKYITKESDPKIRRDVIPYDGQEEATTRVNPYYINPDGSLRFFAMLTTTPDSETSTDEESDNN